MIQFVDDAYALLRDCCALLLPDGLLSLTNTNPYSETYRLAIQQNDLVAARESIGGTQVWHPWFNKFEQRYAADGMVAFPQSIGCTVVGRYGIRCICDYLVDNERRREPGYYAELERLEHALTDVYPYYLLARAYQIIVQKTLEAKPGK
jgi:S-adenosylmethionine-dependent methyltransferase